jgi:hypothetical protein
MIRTIQQDTRTGVQYHGIGPHHFTHEKGALFLHCDTLVLTLVIDRLFRSCDFTSIV